MHFTLHLHSLVESLTHTRTSTQTVALAVNNLKFFVESSLFEIKYGFAPRMCSPGAVYKKLKVRSHFHYRCPSTVLELVGGGTYTRT
jgi:hypothetical protein